MPSVRHPAVTACRRLAACLLVGWLIPAEPARAASLEVAPVSLTFNAAEKSKALTVSNSGSAPIHAQIRVYQWRQLAGKETLTPTQDVIASPPLTQIPPGGKQLLRIMVRSSPGDAAEHSYRLIVDELPGDNLPAAVKSSHNAISFLLRYSIPLFIAPRGATESDALAHVRAWVTTSGASSALWLENRGERHIKLSNVALEGDGAPQTLTPGLLGYVLAGQTMSWPMPRPMRVHAIKAQINDSYARQTLPVSSVASAADTDAARRPAR